MRFFLSRYCILGPGNCLMRDVTCLLRDVTCLIWGGLIFLGPGEKNLSEGMGPPQRGNAQQGQGKRSMKHSKHESREAPAKTA